MTVEEAKQSRAVRLRGVITYYDPEEPDLFVQDSTGGIWVNLEGCQTKRSNQSWRFR